MSDGPATPNQLPPYCCCVGASNLEVFMVVRHHQIDFASGALVFPEVKLILDLTRH